MKKILLLLVALITMGGATSVKAQEKVFADLSKYGDKWNGTSLSFSWNATYSNQLYPVLDLPTGDLGVYKKLVVETSEITNADFFRVLVYNGANLDHSNTFKVSKTSRPTRVFAFSTTLDEKMTPSSISQSPAIFVP